MRIALLSASADLPASGAIGLGGSPPAFRRFAGKSVLAHQIDCAAHLGCARVVCLSSGPGPDLSAARLYATRSGLRFESVDSIVRLAGLITADDEVVLIADGVLPDRAALISALEQRPGVLAFPADIALPLGFERLDATRAWSGALRARGDCAARLADLPSDCDLASSLLRLALQAGARVVELDRALLEGQRWQRRVDPHATMQSEWHWIARQIQPAPFTAPGMAVAERAGLRWAHDAGGGRWARAPHLAALAGGALALAAGLAGWPRAGLGLLLAASMALAVAAIFDRVERLGAAPGKAGLLLPAAGWLRDGLLVWLLALLAATVPGWIGVLLPLLLVGILRLGETVAKPCWRALFGDRIVLLAILAPAAWWGRAIEATALIAAAALIAQLWTARAPAAKLTAD